MKTLTITSARAKLGYWLAKVRRGEEIGIIAGDQVFEIRPVEVTAPDYMEREYGLTKAEADRAAARILARSRRGKHVPLDQLAARVAARRKAQGGTSARRAA